MLLADWDTFHLQGSYCVMRELFVYYVMRELLVYYVMRELLTSVLCDA